MFFFGFEGRFGRDFLADGVNNLGTTPLLADWAVPFLAFWAWPFVAPWFCPLGLRFCHLGLACFLASPRHVRESGYRDATFPTHLVQS